MLFIYSGISRKAPGGWGFYLAFLTEASLNKNPTPVNFLKNNRMKRIIPRVQNDVSGKPPKIQRTITSMLGRNGPEFVETTGTQLQCPYCSHKFRAPQGLVAHKYMHERAGDTILPPKRIPRWGRPERHIPKRAAVLRRPPKPPVSVPSPPEEEHENLVVDSDDKVTQPEMNPLTTTQYMTRRFSVIEKLKIIDKYKESKNISSTCRWVQTEFNRKSFARKSLKQMISKESVFRKASGTKSLRKTVRFRSGMFPRMDKALAQ